MSAVSRGAPLVHAVKRSGVRGFSLIELALSLAVLAIVATGILVPLVTQIQQRNVSTTAALCSTAWRERSDSTSCWRIRPRMASTSSASDASSGGPAIWIGESRDPARTRRTS